MVGLWDQSPKSAPNPYEYHRSRASFRSLCFRGSDAALLDITQGALRVELAEQDALDIREGRATAVHEYYSASTIIVVGMEIEDQQ